MTSPVQPREQERDAVNAPANPAGAPSSVDGSSPLILPRSEHTVSRRDIDDDALRVLYKLTSEGHEAYLVGGGVRDLFLGKKPKDFDIATSAKPSRIKKIFRNCRVVGRRFKIAHVFFQGGNIVEVATFRRGLHREVTTRRGRTVLDDNEFGTAQEDALRRDLTINGLFYDARSFSIIDWVDGVRDLREQKVRMINHPDESFAEDPVRMIRAMRHAARTEFEIDAETWDGIERHVDKITLANPSRLLEEVLRDLRGGSATPYYRLIKRSGLLDVLLPPLELQLREHGDAHPLWGRLEAVDELIRSGRTLTAPVLLCAVFHTVLLPDPAWWIGARNNPPDAQSFMLQQLHELTRHVRVARRDVDRMLLVALHHRKLIQCLERGKLLSRLAHRDYLSEALDFLEIALRARQLPTAELDAWREVAPTPQGPPPRYPPGRERPPHSRRRPLESDTTGESNATASEAGAASGQHSSGEARSDGPPPRRRRRRRRRRKSPGGGEG